MAVYYIFTGHDAHTLRAYPDPVRYLVLSAPLFLLYFFKCPHLRAPLPTFFLSSWDVFSWVFFRSLSLSSRTPITLFFGTCERRRLPPRTMCMCQAQLCTRPFLRASARPPRVSIARVHAPTPSLALPHSLLLCCSSGHSCCFCPSALRSAATCALTC